jgi:hypothetical protein
VAPPQFAPIAHAKGLQEKFVWEVPTGGQLPSTDGKVQMYPCHSFESHVVLLSIDPKTGKVKTIICVRNGKSTTFTRSKCPAGFKAK